MFSLQKEETNRSRWRSRSRSGKRRNNEWGTDLDVETGEDDDEEATINRTDRKWIHDDDGDDGVGDDEFEDDGEAEVWLRRSALNTCCFGREANISPILS